MEELTDKQLEVLKYIGEHLEQHGVPPTQAAIKNYMAFSSKNAAREYLLSLERKGMIQRTSLGSRNLRLTDAAVALLRGLREDSEAGSKREIVWHQGRRKIVVGLAPRAAGGIQLRMFCRKRKLNSPWRPDDSSRAEIWLPTDAARYLASDIQLLTGPRRSSFMIRLAEDDD